MLENKVTQLKNKIIRYPNNFSASYQYHQATISGSSTSFFYRSVFFYFPTIQFLDSSLFGKTRCFNSIVTVTWNEDDTGNTLAKFPMVAKCLD